MTPPSPGKRADPRVGVAGEAPQKLRVRPTVLGALRVYRLLFLRSVVVAGVVYMVVALVQVAHHTTRGAAAATLALAVTLLELAGPLIVQGALVGSVRDLHDGSRPRPLRTLLDGDRSRFRPLLGASFLYAVGVTVGLAFLVAPGLVVAARWSLMAPAVVIESRSVRDARRRSKSLVVGQTASVWACIEILFLLAASGGVVIAFSHLSFVAATIATLVWSTLATPVVAHGLTVIYYRLADPSRPVASST